MVSLAPRLSSMLGLSSSFYCGKYTTIRYLTKESGKVVQDTSCHRIPRLLCGAGCSVTEGEEECHEKVVDSPVNVPEEHCDLSPQTVCRQVGAKRM